MKKLLITVLCLMLACTHTPAFATTDADSYLVDKVWEMNVANYSNTEYIFFGRDGYGFWVRNYVAVDATGSEYKSSSGAWTYYFRWKTFTRDNTDYITISFKDQQEPVNGWGRYHNPHKENTYWLLWNPTFMYLIDTTHEDIDSRYENSKHDLYIFNGVAPASYLIEKYTNEANNAFTAPAGGDGGGSR